MELRFSEVVSTEEDLRAIMGHPGHRVLAKTITSLDAHCRTFIAQSPFMLIATADAQGNMDISPKGDPPGFVLPLDDKTLAIPDRPGNRRADTFSNIIQNPKVGLFFLIPGKQETLRVSGRGRLVRDVWLRERLAAHGKTPDLALVVTVEEAFFHCAKCIIRSDLWQPAAWPDLAGLPSLAEVMVDHGKLADSVAEMQLLIDDNVRDELY